jgi:hypothetical protein
MAIILFAIGLLLFVPFLFLWAINGLFNLDIAYDWMNWFYSLVIIFLLKGNLYSK